MTDNETDNNLVKKVLTEDKEAFKQILERYQRQLYAYLLRTLNFHEEDAKDALSQTFLKIYQNLAGYNPRLKFSSWVYRIAHNEAINIIRKNSKNYSLDMEKVTEVGFEIDFEKPKREDLEKNLSKLSQKDKNLMILFYFEEKSVLEIAEILKISQGSCKTALSRARQKAKEITKKYY